MNITDSDPQIERGHAAFRGPLGGRSCALPFRVVFRRGDVEPASIRPARPGEADPQGPWARLVRSAVDGVRAVLAVLVVLVLLAHATRSLSGFFPEAFEVAPRALPAGSLMAPLPVDARAPARERDRRDDVLAVDERSIADAAGDPHPE